MLHEAGLGGGVGDEGGFAPNLKTNAEPFEYITKAVEKAGFKPGVDFMYAMDPASTEFYLSLIHIYVWGCQFHPEKSSALGQRILKNFVNIVEEAGR